MTIMVDVIEQEYYDPSDATTKTLRVATAPLPLATGARIEPWVADAGTLTRSAFDTGTTTGDSTAGYGTTTLSNIDAALDDLRTMAFMGRPHVRRRGPWLGTYPGDFPIVFQGVAIQPSVGMATLPLDVRDQRYAFNAPFQPKKYGGTGGLDGTADMVGQPIPVTIGRPFNVTPKTVDPEKLIYQFHDGVATVNDVRDKGDRLGVKYYLAVDSAKGMLVSTDASTWTNVYPHSGIYTVAFGAGVIALGDASGNVHTSPEGVVWSTNATGLDFVLGLAFGGGLFVATGFVGADGRLATSPDGITWTLQTTAWSHAGAVVLQSAFYSGSLWVAVGSAGKVFTSPNGITWTARATSFGSNGIHSVTFGAGLWLIGGEAGMLETSPDGITWTPQTTGFGGSDIVTGLTYGAGLYLAVGGVGGIESSPDGVTWTVHPIGFTGFVLNVTYAGEIFVAVGTGAGGNVATSTDGIVWTMQPVLASQATSLLGISYATDLTATDYANTTDLQDDSLAPLPGHYRICPSAGMFRLGGSPAGTITCDPVEGTTSADRTAAQCFVRQGMQRMGYTTGAWSASDVTTSDSKNSAEIGDYIDQETPANTVMNRMMAAIGNYWFGDRQGVIRMKRLDAPSGSGSVLTIQEKGISPRLVRRANNDVGNGTPVYSVLIQFGQNYTVQSASDLAGGVSDANRVIYGRQWTTAPATDTSVLTAYPQALQRTDTSLLIDPTAAATEAARRLALWGVLRDGYDCALEWTDASVALEIGDEVTLVHSRFGLSAGADFIVLGLLDNPKSNRITPSLWGRAA